MPFPLRWLPFTPMIFMRFPSPPRYRTVPRAKGHEGTAKHSNVALDAFLHVVERVLVRVVLDVLLVLRVHLEGAHDAVVGVGGQHLVAVLHLDDVLEAGAVQGSLQAFLRQTQAERSRGIAHLLSEGNSLFNHVVVGNDLVREAPLEQLLGAEAVGGS